MWRFSQKLQRLQPEGAWALKPPEIAQLVGMSEWGGFWSYPGSLPPQ